MKIKNVPFRKIDWTDVTAESVPGETGASTIKSVPAGDIQSRIVTYDAGYVADHWCVKGHIALVLEGQLILEFQNGARTTLSAGQGFQVGDDGEPHRVRTVEAATAFIVD